MNDYLDVGVVRIQQWLTRTPWLRGRRGASTMLTTATGAGAVEKVLDAHAPGLAEPNPEVGDVDGVVSLRLHDPEPRSVEQTEQAVVKHLRAALPAASFKVSRWSGESYVDAMRDGSPLFEHEWPAAVAEWPPGRPCQWCETWPAHAVVNERTREGNKDLAMCADCIERQEPNNAGYNTSPQHLPGPERELIRRALERGLPPKLPDEFQELATMDGIRETHIAAVQADGNAIGDVISKIRTTRTNAERALPAAINEATWEALLDAVGCIWKPDDARRLPIIPHLVGGDDVLVSVPARRGWAFSRAFQECFNDRISEAIADMPKGVPPISVSVGLVFHHRTTPFFVFTELSETLLKRAKSEHQGKIPALAWQEITRDGANPTARPSMPLTTLDKFWSSLRNLADLQQSTRQRLATLLHNEGNSETLDEHLGRLGLTATAAPFRAGGGIDLRNALDMVRWW